MVRKKSNPFIYQTKETKLLTYSWVLFVIQVIFTCLYVWRLPPQIPMNYSLPYGRSQLSPWYWLLFIPLFSLLIILLNSFMLKISHHGNTIFQQYFSWVTLMIIGLLSIALIHRIILIF